MRQTASTHVLEHPAAAAWQRLDRAGATPVAITPLQEKPKGGVYALHGAGPGGCTVVAKRCKLAKARAEHLLYDRILPSLPLESLACHGFVEEPDWGWLFIGLATGEPYRASDPDHRVMAGRWLAALHTAAASRTAPADLPDRSLAFYRDLLHEARARVAAGCTSVVLSREHRRALAPLAETMDDLAHQWPRLERLCLDVPATLVHGDFARKNLVIDVTAPEGLCVFDWGTGGWGLPVADLAQNEPGETYWVSPDLATYHEAIRAHWPALELERVRLLAGLGKIVRALAATHGDAKALAGPWAEGVMHKLPVYARHLRDGMTAAGLAAPPCPNKPAMEGGLR